MQNLAVLIGTTLSDELFPESPDLAKVPLSELYDKEVSLKLTMEGSDGNPIELDYNLAGHEAVSATEDMKTQAKNELDTMTYLNEPNPTTNKAKIIELIDAAETEEEINQIKKDASELNDYLGEIINKENEFQDLAEDDKTQILEAVKDLTSRYDAENAVRAYYEQKELDEAKEDAKQAIDELAISEDDKAGFKNQIDQAESIEEVEKIQAEALAEELSQAKTNAEKAIDELAISEEDKADFKTQIEEAKSVEAINKIVEDAKALEQELLELAKAKEDAEKAIDELAISEEDKEEFKSQIEKAESVEAIDEIVEDAKALEQELSELSQAKEDAKSFVNGLDLYENQKENFNSQIDEATSTEEIDKIKNDAQELLDYIVFAKTEDETLADLTEEERAKALEVLEESLTKEEAEEGIAEVVEEKQARELDEAKQAAKEEINSLPLDQDQKDEFIGQIDDAESIEDVNKIVEDAKALIVTWTGIIKIDGKEAERKEFTGTKRDVSDKLQVLANTYIGDDKYEFVDTEGTDSEQGIFVYNFKTVEDTEEPTPDTDEIRVTFKIKDPKTAEFVADENGVIYPTFVFPKGKDASEISAPKVAAKKGYEFKGWDPELKGILNEDTVYTAIIVKVDEPTPPGPGGKPSNPIKPVEPSKPIEDEKTEEPIEKPETKIEVNRTAGENRFDTALEIARENYKAAETVILADGSNYPDALAASALAGLKDAPLLLTSPGALDAIKAEMERLGSKEVIIVGGENSVSLEEENFFADFADVKRIAGVNRYETAIKIAEEVQKENSSSQVIVADGSGFADALAIGPYAAREGLAIILAEGDLLPGADEFLEEYAIKEALVVGGKNSVGNLEEYFENITRVAGDNRFETSVKIAEKFFPEAKAIALASGENFPDALAVAALAGRENMPLLLTMKDELPKEIENYIEKSEIERVEIFGGKNTVADLF